MKTDRSFFDWTLPLVKSELPISPLLRTAKCQFVKKTTDNPKYYRRHADIFANFWSPDCWKKFQNYQNCCNGNNLLTIVIEQKKQYTVLSCFHHSIKWSILHYCLSQTDFGGAYIHRERFLFSNSKINMIYSLLNRGLHKSSDWSKSNSQLTILKMKFFKKRLFRHLPRLILLGAVAWSSFFPAIRMPHSQVWATWCGSLTH